MALFGRGKSKGGEGVEAASSEGGFTPNPERAEKFFTHARAAHDATNYAYAMTLWLQGLKQDPTSREALERFFDAAARFLQANPRAKGPTKEQAKNFEGRDAPNRFAMGLLQWGTRPEQWSHGLKAMEDASKLDLDESAYWIGERVLNRAMGDPKAKKDSFVQLMRLFATIGGYDKAVIAGERALALDPTDSKLDHEVRNMSAESTMTSGGYDRTGQAGGFRSNVRNIEKQRELDSSERVVKSEAELDRQIEVALEDHRRRPEDSPAAKKLGRLLLERGTAEDEKAAIKLYKKMHETTGEYAFQRDASDVQMRVGRRRLKALAEKAKADPGNEELQAKLASGRRQILEFEIAQYRERAREYPTDLKLRYELGRRLLEGGEHEEAIEAFQAAQGAAGIGPLVNRGLGDAFGALGYLVESVNAYRSAIDAHPTENDELALELRYGLMRALRRQAEDNSDLPAAEEAFALAAWISSKKISFRDVREQREAIQSLIKSLKGQQG
jgi:tetratricopeptide (TPR) repeat protein